MELGGFFIWRVGLKMKGSRGSMTAGTGRSRDSEQVLKKGIKLHPSLKLFCVIISWSDAYRGKALSDLHDWDVAVNEHSKDFWTSRCSCRQQCCRSPSSLKTRIRSQSWSERLHPLMIHLTTCRAAAGHGLLFQCRQVGQDDRCGTGLTLSSGIKNETSTVWKLCKQ
eukprot:747704-Hanusia_phi.AAC.2